MGGLFKLIYLLTVSLPIKPGISCWMQKYNPFPATWKGRFHLAQSLMSHKFYRLASPLFDADEEPSVRGWVPFSLVH
jgi:hypothetical protein